MSLMLDYWETLMDIPISIDTDWMLKKSNESAMNPLPQLNAFC
jgi:hypothetical protein